MKTRINKFCYITIGLLGIYISIYQSIINTINRDYSISNAVAGVIISMHFIGSLVAPVIFGEISDRVGKKAVVIEAFIIFIIGLLLVYLFHSIVIVAIGIFLIGGGFGVIEGTLSGLLSDVNAGEANRVISISQIFFSIGAVAGPLIVLSLIDLYSGWKELFLFLIILYCAALVYLVQLKFERNYNVTRYDQGLISVKLVKKKIFILLCISIFIYVGIEEGVAFWLNTYFKSTYNASQLWAYALSGYWGSMIIGRYIVSRFAKYSKQLMAGGLLVSLLFLVTALLVKNSIICFICFIGVGLGFSAIWPIIMSMAAGYYPEYTGTALGILMTCSAAGGIIVPFLIGFIADFSMIGMAFWIIPVMTVLILVIQMHICLKCSRSC